MSKAHQIAVKLTERVAAIRRADGFATDIGQRVYRGRRYLDELPATVIDEGPDRGEFRLGSFCVSLPFVIEAHDELPEDSNPNDHSHLILADLKRAVFGPADHTLGGLARAMTYKGRQIGQRAPGVPAVFASIEIEVEYVETP